MNINKLEPIGLFTLASGLVYSMGVLMFNTKEYFKFHFIFLTLVIFFALICICSYKYMKYKYTMETMDNILSMMSIKEKK